MKPRIVAVKGVNNCGKTTTIRLAYRMLLRADGVTVFRHVQIRKEVRGAILEINRVKVGFASLGDLVEILEDEFDELARKWKCGVIVCACRSRGGTFDYLEGLGYEVNWIEKERVKRDDQELANQKKAAELIEVINGAVKKVKTKGRAVRGQ